MYKSLRDLPTLFRGVFWDDGWEYDAPSVVYLPVKLYSPFGSNSGHIDTMVEDYCILLADGTISHKSYRWTETELKIFKNYGWSPRGFARRKLAWHVTIRVKWFHKPDGQLSFKITRCTERWGLDQGANDDRRR